MGITSVGRNGLRVPDLTRAGITILMDSVCTGLLPERRPFQHNNAAECVLCSDSRRSLKSET